MYVAARPELPGRWIVTVALSCLWGALLAADLAHGQPFVTFESGQVRPLALSPDGTRLFAVNTPDNRLEIFDVDALGITHVDTVPVGMEPVAVGARSDSEVWVVNHLSDSVSIVDVSSTPPRVVRTLLVGDEPRDIVFAGPREGGPTTPFRRAFITAAHRGQNNPNDPQLITEGVGRADVWVFDALALGGALGGTPIEILTHFGDTPRALAATADGATVYAAVFHSGNQTTTLSEGAVCNGFDSAAPCNLPDGIHVPGGLPGAQVPGGLPAPDANLDGDPAPEVGLIVKWDEAAGEWRDQDSRNWTNAVRFDLPDLDVFEIDATATPPVETDSFAHVGTVLFNMIVNPDNGKLYVTNTEARNEVRFEGPGGGGSTVRGHLHEARVTVIDGGGVSARHLNKHINYSTVPVPAGVKDDSLATPVGMAISADDDELFVAAFGSSKIGVFNTTALENDMFMPDAASHIAVSGGGPTGIVFDDANDRLYVLTRFDNAISVIDRAAKAEVDHVPVYNPEPASVVAGRPVLYDAAFTSSNGEASCSACHVFGDFDSLAWDLGNPDDEVMPNPNPIGPIGTGQAFHPMKGPMATQTLRGMANAGPMHWRGDRTGGNAVPPGSPLDEDLAFKAFNVAFGGLLGRDEGEIPDPSMQAFTDFILQVTLPPNPIRNLNNSLTASEQSGRDFYLGPILSDAVANCNGCHTLDPSQGFFGTGGLTTFENETQEVKVPHLRNMYQKVGMFGMPRVPFITNTDHSHQGDQVRGFGFLHDGSIDTVFRFYTATVFIPGFTLTGLGDPMRRDVEAFMMAFDTDLAPIVGQQITLTSGNGGTVGPRIDLMIARALTPFVMVGNPGATECDLVVKGVLENAMIDEDRGWLLDASGDFISDRVADGFITDGALRAQATTAGQELTYTCVPPGSGTRIGIDRDLDGFRDRDEIDAGSDPADPGSIPGGGTTTTTTTVPGTTTTTTTLAVPDVLVQTKSMKLTDDSDEPINFRKRKLRFKSSTKTEPPANQIVVPPPGGAGDPTVHGAELIVYNTAGGTEFVFIALNPLAWEILGNVSNPKGYRFTGNDPNGPVQKIIIKDDKISITAGRDNWPYTLDEPSQGSIGIQLTLGTAVTWCAEGGEPVPVFAPKKDETDKFIARRNTPPPVACPPLPGGSPSGAFVEGSGGLFD
jgi:DNA-binding beta-propeller fold protein YncE